MQQAIFAILTDEQARDKEVIEAILNQEFIVGAPWFFSVPTEPSTTQPISE